VLDAAYAAAMVRVVIETLFLPPASTLWLLLLGTIVRRWWPRLGRTLQILSLLLLWTLSTPAVAGALLGSLQPYPALPSDGALPAADAIVVLSAEADPVAAEYGGAQAGMLTMQRLRYAAALQRRTGLPLLCSGGVPRSGLPSLAAMMAQAATTEFGVRVRWQEDRSADTRENASFSASMLKADGVKTVLLVTSAWHLPRAVRCFEAEGLQVVPAPTGFRAPPAGAAGNWLPHWHGLRDSSLALHEWIGRLYYAVAR
jgi:uncharacterized SAM-binding protein YcdF (DUF218 family)